MRFIKFNDFLLEQENKGTDPKLQIIRRGTIGLTSKADDESDKLMKEIYDKYLHLVLIKGEDEYTRDERIPDNRRNNEIDFSLPILNMTSRKHALLDNPKAKIFNQVEDYQISADKVEFSKQFEGSKYLPKTVFKLSEIDNLKFPIIAKPKGGFSAQGIELFKSKSDAQKSTVEFDLWSEAKEIKTEFRLFIMNGEMIHLAERVKNIDNDKSVGKKKVNEKIDLVYIDQDLDTFPKKLKDKLIDIHNEVKKKVKLDFYDIDLILDTNDEFWIPEINGAPGIGPSTFYQIYKSWTKMAYNRDIKESTEKDLIRIRDTHREFMKTEYSKEYKKSLHPI